MPISVDISVDRYTVNKLNEDKLTNQVKEITGATKNRASAPGIIGKHTKLEGPEEIEKNGEIKYYYKFVVRLEKEIRRSEPAAARVIELGKKMVIRAAEARGWTARDIKDIKEQARIAESRPPFKVGELTQEVLDTYFGNIYDREAHLRIIHQSVQIAVETDFEERPHSILWGKPASAKSSIFHAFKKWYENDSDIERVAMINSTTISKAGIENFILEKAQTGILPQILCFDEIEKFAPDQLLCLLSIMDISGLISRLNAKIGKQEATAKVLIWAICNNDDIIRKFQNGALFSRFCNALPCVRPSKILMIKIAINALNKRRAKGLVAKDEWAEKSVEYAFDNGITDPRRILGFLAGKDRLLDGSYFKDLEQIEKVYEDSEKMEV